MSNLLRLSYWFDTSVTEQRAGAAMWFVVALGVLWAGAAAVAWRRRRVPRDVAAAQMIAGLLASAVALGRLYAVPGLGWRVGWLLAGLAALSPFVRRGMAQAMRSGMIADVARAMAFIAPPQPRRYAPLALGLWVAFLVIGCAGVFGVVRVPVWIAPLLIGALIGAAMSSRAARVDGPGAALSRAALAPSPLLFAFAVLGLRLLAGLLARVLTGEYRVVEPFGALLNLPLTTIVAAGCACALSLYLAAAAAGRVTAYLRLAAVALIAGSIVWSAWTALELRTRGVSGSDPYAYAQMGVDLAARGTVFHRFPLVAATYDLGIPSEPIVHVGYKIPADIRREAPTVWPPGYAVFTALGYLAGGEAGLYLITPALNLLSLLATAGLALTVLRGAPSGLRWPISALTVFLTATSYQQVEWQLIPMADVAAQLLSILALTLGLRAAQARRGRSYALATVAGLCIGAAFGIRYTQVLIAPAVALALYWGAGEAAPRRDRLATVAVCALAALLAALPVLAYHATAFGGPFNVGSEEGQNFSLARIPETALRIVNDLLWYREYGLVWPFAVLGGVALWKVNRRTALVLAAYAIPLALFHVAYWPLRLRDILSLFPLFSLAVASGATGLVVVVRGRVTERVGAAAPAACALFALLLFGLSYAFALRSVQTLQLPQTRGFGAFGYMVREQRASFNRIAELTPSNAVVASTLNSGAIDLHSGRLSFRPAKWSTDELGRFVERMRADGVGLYVLADGDELQPAIAALRERYELAELAVLDVPYYFPGSGSENRAVPLYRVTER